MKYLPVIMGLAIVVSACNPTLRNHGYIPTENKPQSVQPGVDSKTSVIAQLGNPSATGTFDAETWYYLSSSRENLAYLRPVTSERRVVSIKFDGEGMVNSVTQYGLDDGRVVNFENRKTPTAGRELGVLEQILSTIGAVPAGTIGRDNDVPGGGRGN